MSNKISANKMTNLFTDAEFIINYSVNHKTVRAIKSKYSQLTKQSREDLNKTLKEITLTYKAINDIGLRRKAKLDEAAAKQLENELDEAYTTLADLITQENNLNAVLTRYNKEKVKELEKPDNACKTATKNVTPEINENLWSAYKLAVTSISEDKYESFGRALQDLFKQYTSEAGKIPVARYTNTGRFIISLIGCKQISSGGETYNYIPYKKDGFYKRVFCALSDYMNRSIEANTLSAAAAEKSA